MSDTCIKFVKHVSFYESFQINLQASRGFQQWYRAVKRDQRYTSWIPSLIKETFSYNRSLSSSAWLISVISGNVYVDTISLKYMKSIFLKYMKYTMFSYYKFSQKQSRNKITTTLDGILLKFGLSILTFVKQLLWKLRQSFVFYKYALM